MPLTGIEVSVFRMCDVTGKFPASQHSGPGGMKGVLVVDWHNTQDDCLIFADEQGVIKFWNLHSGLTELRNRTPLRTVKPKSPCCRVVTMVSARRLHRGLSYGRGVAYNRLVDPVLFWRPSPFAC